MKVAEIKVSYSNYNEDKIKVSSSKTAYDVIMSHWNLETIEYQEEVKLLLLNRANFIQGVYELSKGGTTSCTVDIKMILAVALKCNSEGVILVHNHPSGSILPSHSDKLITSKLKKACELVDIHLLDHLIISKDEYYSFMDENNSLEL